MSMDTTAEQGGLLARYALPPEEIEARSLSIVEAALRDRFAQEDERFVATRVVYASGDLDLANSLHFSPAAVEAGVQALRQGAALVTDVRMVLAGISRYYAGLLGCQLHCAIDDPAVARRARTNDIPRAAEAMRALRSRLDGAVVAIGNAPTALLSLLDMVDAAAVRPALIAGMPVGFVAAAESKQELRRRDVPYVTITGARGGSPLAAAAVNALLRLAATDGVSAGREQTAILFAGHGSRARDAAEAMLAAVERVRGRGIFPVVETGYLELCGPDIPEALRRCVEQGATRVLVVPYFLHDGLHIRRDIPAVLRREVDQYPGLRVSMGRPIGLQADLADVMLAGAIETEQMPDIRDVPPAVSPQPSAPHPAPRADEQPRRGENRLKAES